MILVRILTKAVNYAAGAAIAVGAFRTFNGDDTGPLLLAIGIALLVGMLAGAATVILDAEGNR